MNERDRQMQELVKDVIAGPVPKAKKKTYTNEEMLDRFFEVYGRPTVTPKTKSPCGSEVTS